jgi:hypothetical protein
MGDVVGANAKEREIPGSQDKVTLIIPGVFLVVEHDAPSLGVV